MAEIATGPGSLTVSDGVAIIAGAAVASVHLRGVVNERFLGPGWFLIWAAFSMDRLVVNRTVPLFGPKSGAKADAQT